jgi:hypothetical protein
LLRCGGRAPQQGTALAELFQVLCDEARKVGSAHQSDALVILADPLVERHLDLLYVLGPLAHVGVPGEQQRLDEVGRNDVVHGDEAGQHGAPRGVEGVLLRGIRFGQQEALEEIDRAQTGQGSVKFPDCA